MKKRHQKIGWLTASLLGVVLAGCNMYRPIPSHGGGKRFNEEQRVMAAAIRIAISGMNLESLAGKRINVNIVAMAQSGGGNLVMPGFTAMNVGYSQNSSNTSYLMPYIASSNKIDGFNANVSLNAAPTLWPTVFPTDQDLQYLEGVLKMRFRHENIAIAPGDSEETLYILVDVLGTNRSKEDSVIAWKDRLAGSCQLTYYIFNERTGQILQQAQQTHAEGVYSESSFFGFAAYKITREFQEVEPDALPIHRPRTSEPYTQTTSINRLVSKPAVLNGAPAACGSEWEQVLQRADSYLMSGNIDAAEEALNQVRLACPGHPGLEPVNSRLQNAKKAMAERQIAPN